MPNSSGTAPATSPQSLANFGCENCRQQHLKCDRVTPSCGRCSATRRECVQTGLKIRLSKKGFTKHQKWVKTPRRLVFIDESRAVTRDFGHADDETDEADGDFASPGIPEIFFERVQVDLEDSEEHEEPHEPQEPPEPEQLVATSSSPTLSPGPSASPSDRFISRPQHLERIQDPGLLEYMNRVYVNQPLCPFSKKIEARLFEHFVQNLAKWLDLCDPAQSFQTIVPQEARRCTVLMNAIFALAARHMRFTDRGFDPLLDDKYYASCWNELHPMLNFEETTIDQNLFAATIILRVFEEMGAKTGEDPQGYMLSIYRFVELGSQLHNNNHHLAPGTLGAASFWVGLRQEIYVAVMKREPVRLQLAQTLTSHLNKMCGEIDDHTWANRAVVHCAEVLNFCYSKTDVSSSQWHNLYSWNKQWPQLLPSSFVPTYQQEGGTFPEEWYHQSCHVIGIQHHLLAELFLVRRDPSLSHAELTSHIQSLVRRICGIGLANQWTPPGMFTACMAIAAFGDWFQDRGTQEGMLKILKQAETDHVRPTKEVRDQMRRIWGWGSGDSQTWMEGGNSPWQV